MPLFGAGTRAHHIDDGTFSCPHCAEERSYRLEQQRDAIFVFGVPVLSRKATRELVICEACGGSFNLDVLRFTPSQPQRGAAQLLARVKQRLERGYDAAYITQDLIDNGVDPHTAHATVQIALSQSNAQGGAT